MNEGRAASQTGPEIPYPGLRPYDLADEPVFFGRERQVAALLERMEESSFLAVVGSSGSGKSSLVRAGLRKALDRGFLDGVDSWCVITMRPGRDPYRQLAAAMSAEVMRLLPGADAVAWSESAVLALLKTTGTGLQKASAEIRLLTGCSLLVIVDQFEEIFSFRRLDTVALGSAGCTPRSDAEAFVQMLLNTVAPGLPAGDASQGTWIVLTMRSDFIGDCESFLGLPEMVSKAQFLVPRMNRLEMTQAIVRPGEVRRANWQPFTIEPSLVNRIINDAGDRPDHLPLMQHALMRAWSLAVKECSPGPIVITETFYETVGELKSALSQHADEALTDLSTPELTRVAEHLFLGLSEVSPDGKLTRRRPQASEICGITGASLETVSLVVDTFRREQRNFVVPTPAPAPAKDGGSPLLEAGTVLDISHEALLRQWPTFIKWQEAEDASAAEFRRLADTAWRICRKEASTLDTPSQTRIEKSRAERQWNGAWAERYLPRRKDPRSGIPASKPVTYEKAIKLLEVSTVKNRRQAEQKRREQQEREQEKLRQAEERQRQLLEKEQERARLAVEKQNELIRKEEARLRARNRVLVIVGSVAAVIVAFSCWGIYEHINATKERNEAEKARKEAEKARDETRVARIKNDETTKDLKEKEASLKNAQGTLENQKRSLERQNDIIGKRWHQALNVAAPSALVSRTRRQSTNQVVRDSLWEIAGRENNDNSPASKLLEHAFYGPMVWRGQTERMTSAVCGLSNTVRATVVKSLREYLGNERIPNPKDACTQRLSIAGALLRLGEKLSPREMELLTGADEEADTLRRILNFLRTTGRGLEKPDLNRLLVKAVAGAAAGSWEDIVPLVNGTDDPTKTEILNRMVLNHSPGEAGGNLLPMAGLSYACRDALKSVHADKLLRDFGEVLAKTTPQTDPEDLAEAAVLALPLIIAKASDSAKEEFRNRQLGPAPSSEVQAIWTLLRKAAGESSLADTALRKVAEILSDPFEDIADLTNIAAEGLIDWCTTPATRLALAEVFMYGREKTTFGKHLQNEWMPGSLESAAEPKLSASATGFFSRFSTGDDEQALLQQWRRTVIKDSSDDSEEGYSPLYREAASTGSVRSIGEILSKGLRSRHPEDWLGKTQGFLALNPRSLTPETSQQLGKAAVEALKSSSLARDPLGQARMSVLLGALHSHLTPADRREPIQVLLGRVRANARAEDEKSGRDSAGTGLSASFSASTFDRFSSEENYLIALCLLKDGFTPGELKEFQSFLLKAALKGSAVAAKCFRKVPLPAEAEEECRKLVRPATGTGKINELLSVRTALQVIVIDPGTFPPDFRREAGARLLELLEKSTYADDSSAGPALLLVSEMASDLGPELSMVALEQMAGRLPDSGLLPLEREALGRLSDALPPEKLILTFRSPVCTGEILQTVLQIFERKTSSDSAGSVWRVHDWIMTHGTPPMKEALTSALVRPSVIKFPGSP